jgi:hypothetical protein
LCQSMGALGECLLWSEAEGWLQPPGQPLRTYPPSKPWCVEYCLQSAKQMRFIQKSIGDCCALPAQSPSKATWHALLYGKLSREPARALGALHWRLQGFCRLRVDLAGQVQGVSSLSSLSGSCYCGFCQVTGRHARTPSDAIKYGL